MQHGWSFAPLIALTVLLFAVHVSGEGGYDDAVRLVQRGDVLIAEGDYEAALPLFIEAVEADPYYSIAWSRRGEVEMTLGKYSGALQSFERALSLDPYSTKAWNRKGDVLVYLGQERDAIAQYDRALAVNPNDLASFVDKGAALQRLGEDDAAMETFMEVVQIADREVRKHPNDARYDANLWVMRGEALYRLRRYDEAIESFTTALSIDPRHAGATQSRATILAYLEGIKTANGTLPTAVPYTVATTTWSGKPIPYSSLSAIASLIIAALAISVSRR